MFKPPFNVNPENGIIKDAVGSIVRTETDNRTLASELCQLLNERVRMKADMKRIQELGRYALASEGDRTSALYQIVNLSSK